MVDTSENPNTICVSMVPNGCFKQQFDTTYPVHLKGLISQDEYQDSINRINSIMNPTKTMFILGTVFAASMISGMIFIIIGGITEANSDTSGFTTLLIVTVLGLIVFGIGYCIMHFQYRTQIRRAIDEESIKYALKLPIPCNWRLETTGNHLVIDIDRWTIQENAMHYIKHDLNEPSSSLQGDDYDAPPPYTV